MTKKDLIAMLPVAFCSAAAHSSSVLALNAGSVTFGQIVKAGEPVFAALVNTFMYGKSPSIAKWLCLPVVIGGVVFSCLKPTVSIPAAEAALFRQAPAAGYPFVHLLDRF